MTRPFILALGDSLTAGYGLPTAHGFPARLEALLQVEHPGTRVQNAGISGNTTADALRRLPRTLLGLSARPHLAIVELGGNDVLRGVPAAQTRANLDAILLEIGRCGIPVLLATFDVPAALRPYARDHDTLYADLAARHGVPTTPFFPPGVLGHPDHVLPDRLHPNARAIDRVAEAMLPVVLPLLAAALKATS